LNAEKLDVFDRFMALPCLRVFSGFYKKNKAVLLYLFFGTLTTAISIGTFILFDTVIGINELFANVISWICAVLFAYTTNRIWVFRSAATGAAARQELLSFFVGRLSTLGLEEVILLFFVTLLKFNSTMVKVATQVVVLASNYVISKQFVFRKRGH